jgi:hypothetical protein
MRVEELRVTPPRRRVASAAATPASYVPVSSSVMTSLHSSKQQDDIALKAHIASACFKCFRGMLQVYYIDVAKVDRDVAHVEMTIHMFQVYIPNVSSVLECDYFISTL